MHRPIFVAFMLFLAALPATASADTLQFKLLQNQSRATFKTDAPLATLVGTTPAAAEANEPNKLVTFEIRSVEIAGPLEPGRETPAKVHGTLTVKQRPVDVVADARVTYVKLTPAPVGGQKRVGFPAG